MSRGCRRVRSGPALISQSGNISLNLTMNRRGIDFSYVISLGNQSSVTTEDCLEHFATRSEVTAVGIHAESIVDPVAFGRAALACRDTRTPVVVLKTGRSKEAERITSSHTAALSAPAAAYDALFERYGVVTAESIPDFMTTLGLLDTVGPIPGNRLVSVSCSGGEAALVADRSARYPVTFPAFGPEHRDRIAATLPQMVTITNPLDYHTFIWGDEPALERCFTEVVAGPFDAAMLVIDWPSGGNDDTDWWPALRAFATLPTERAEPAWWWPDSRRACPGGSGHSQPGGASAWPIRSMKHLEGSRRQPRTGDGWSARAPASTFPPGPGPVLP